MLVMSERDWARASSARTRSTLACCDWIRAATSITAAVTSSVDTLRVCSVPRCPIWSRVSVNLAAGIRRVSVAVDRPSSICRSSLPTSPPAPIASEVSCAALALTLSTRTVIEPV